MAPVVVEHIKEAAADLERRLEDAGVITISKEATAPSQSSVQAARKANGEALNATRQAGLVVCLHQQVQVVVLDAKVGNAQAEALSSARKGGKNDATEPLCPQVADAVTHSQRDVHGMVPAQRGSPKVRHLSFGALWFAAGAGTRSAPQPERQ